MIPDARTIVLNMPAHLSRFPFQCHYIHTRAGARILLFLPAMLRRNRLRIG